MSDTEILQKIKEDKSKYVLFYRKYVNKIFKYSYYKLNCNKQDAEDVTSEVFLSTLEKIENIKTEADNWTVLPYLYITAKNIIIKRWNKTNRTVEISEYIEDNFSDNEDFTKEILDQYSAEEILKIVAKFDSESADVIFLKIYEDYTFAQISELLHISESAVKMRYYRIIANVTNLLKKV
ncbi:MAG TPA: RNA polymerase sigma factor [Candidatus Dojkabacteria bacterium]|nr:RNA polymerase sigma factor [Candidatus Dojkabacteria bacterium]